MATELARRAIRISVNKLGEYMIATPLRRRQIVQDQLRPKAFIVPRYSEAQQTIVKYLLSDPRELFILRGEIERLRIAPSATSWEQQRKALCIAALEAFTEMSDRVQWNGMTATAAAFDQPRLPLGRVEISVRPEVLLQGLGRAGQPTHGAIKLYFSKTIPLNEHSGGYVATALQTYLQRQATDGQTDHKHCLVVDVFSGQVFTAARAFARRLNDLRAACEEIARAWTE